MCNHNWKKVNDVTVCVNCGLTRACGKVIFDRELINYKRKRRKNEKRK